MEVKNHASTQKEKGPAGSDLLKFITAQEGVFRQALAEIRQGQKRTHWMWFIFPQLQGLGKSDMAKTYGLADLDAAKAYLADPILGPRLTLITEALLKLETRDAVDIFGPMDAVKLRSCMTLFAHASENPDSLFNQVLEQYFGGREDTATQAILAIQSYDFR